MDANAPARKPMDKKPPTQKREDPGLKLDPKGRWWVDCYINGQRVRKCVGKKSDAKEALAKEKERGRLALLFPERVESAQAKKLTVADLVARFQPELEANCRSHKNPTRSGAVAAEFFGSKPVSQIKPRPAFASASTVAKGRSGPKNTYVLLREALYEMDQAKEQMRVAQARLDAATHRLLEVLQKSESKGATKSH